MKHHAKVYYIYNGAYSKDMHGHNLNQIKTE